MIPSVKEQLEKWVAGESIHNTERDECCPDFSCCNKNVNTPIEARRAFAKAYMEDNESLQHSMLGGFLGDALASEEAKVYVADGTIPSTEH
jgi:hypothetical protein